MIRGEDGSMFLKIGPKGCTSSDVWDDGFGGQVTQIFIWHAKVIHGIQTVYQRVGTTVVGEMHGSDEDNFNAVCLDGPLTRVSGHYDRMIVDIDEMFGKDDYGLKVINSLEFGTNTSSYGPFGTSGIGEAFSFSSLEQTQAVMDHLVLLGLVRHSASLQKLVSMGSMADALKLLVQKFTVMKI